MYKISDVMQLYSNSYLEFNRKQWIKLGNSIPVILKTEEIKKIRATNNMLSIKEIIEIYFPLSKILSSYASCNIRKQLLFKNIITAKIPLIPYIIGITGSVAAGKSTIAYMLKHILSTWPEHPNVELITTDGFLYPNKILKKHNLMNKKGFPQSYDIHSLIDFLLQIKSGKKKLPFPSTHI